MQRQGHCSGLQVMQLAPPAEFKVQQIWWLNIK
jgi:hypothetical protein